MPLDVVLTEGEADQVVSENVASLVVAHDIGVARFVSDGRWRISDIKKVGVVCDGGIRLTVRPKVSVARLFYLMQFSGEALTIHASQANLASDSELYATVLHFFARQVEQVIVQGLCQDYLACEDSGQKISGRISFVRQLRRRPGFSVPIEFDRDERSIDILENQLLKAALHQVVRIQHGDVLIKELAGPSLHRLSSVTLRDFSRGVPSVRLNRLNAHYGPALDLATLILRNLSISENSGSTSSYAFLVEMWRVFEGFLESKARAFTLSTDFSFSGQLTRYHLDKQRIVLLRPDLTWFHSGHPVAVADVKYKRLSSGRPANSDLYQLLSYCIRLGAKRGFLIYPFASELDLDLVHPEIRISIRSIDLAQPVLDLEQQVAELWAEILGGDA